MYRHRWNIGQDRACTFGMEGEGGRREKRRGWSKGNRMISRVRKNQNRHVSLKCRNRNFHEGDATVEQGG